MKTFLPNRWFIFLSLVLSSVPVARAQSPGPGSALNLDGASGFAQVTNGVWFNGNFTIEGWVYVRSYNNWSRLIDFADGPNTNNVFLALSSGTSGLPTFGVYLNNNGSPNFSANTPLPLNQWAHLAATLSGTTGTIYINGINVGSGTLNSPPNVVRTNNYIGRSNYSVDAYANALFDEIRIWNVARTQNQIQAFMHRSLVGNETGLVGYWRMDEGAGTTLTDSSGHGQTATLFGGTTWSNSTAPLTIGPGTALNFSNTNCQTVQIPQQAALNAYPLTVMTWFMVPTNSNGGALVNKYVSSSKNGYQLFLAGDLRAWYFHDSANNVFNNGVMDAGPVNDGLWHHAALAVDAAGGRLYLDGVLKSSVGWSGTPGAPTTTQPLAFGIYPGDSCFSGQLDEVSIWNTALSTAQIQTFMHRSLQGTESGLLAYYRLDEGSGTNTIDGTGNGYNGTLAGPPTWIPSGATFTIATPPTVTTLPATSILATAATLNASVNPGGSAGVYFRWGPTTNYGNVTGATNLSGGSLVPVSMSITGLNPGVSYHFQAVATNAAGTNFGGDLSFSVALFTNVASFLPPLYVSSIAWGDFNNDGLLDLLVTGATNGSVGDGISQIWQNLGNGSFSNMNVSLPGVSGSSVAWGDFDNDGFLDILLTGNDRSGNGLSQVWHNNGDGTFSLISSGLPGVGDSSVALADFDNDGRLDILLTGTSSSGLISQVWRNQGDGTFANMNVPLPGVNFGSVACNDFDKDGNVDILLTGVGVSGRLTQLWRNNGDGTFTKVNTGLPAVRESSVAWADFDNDGFPDIVLSGGGLAQVWHNNQDGTFSNLNVGLPIVAYSSVAVGDFDNDGLPDILMSGTPDSTGPGAFTQLFRNLGNGSFTNVAVNLPSAWIGSLAWADFDNDGRLDFLMTGWDTNDDEMTLLWQNLNTQTNNAPAAPIGTAAAAASSGVTLSWTAGSDAQTPAAGLTYNVRVGTNSGGGQILSAESGFDGFRRVAQAGNAGQRLSTTLRGLTAGTTYYWSVQSVDSGFAGSPFSAEGTFIVAGPGVLTGPSLIASATSEQLTGSVNPNGSDSGSWFEWGATTNYGNETEPYLISAGNSAFIPVTNLVTGLTPGTVYHYRLVGTNAFGTNLGADSTFTVPLAPSVTTLDATIVVPTSALLNGTVLPNNAPTVAWFQWGTDTNYGATSAPISLSMTNVAAVALSNLLTSLTPGTQYHFLLSASNIAGIGSGGNMAFTTPAPSVPSVTSLAADGITPNRATLHGTVAPNGAATAAWFQWGTTPGYGNNTALFAIDASNLSGLAISNSLSGLAAGTVYYYRLAATNSAGTNFGAGLNLTTLPVTAPSATTLAASAVTASSATLNGAVNPNGADTLAWFQYGTNTSYGSVTPSTLVSSNVSAAVSLSNSVSGLVAGVVYHFQLIASNSVGVSLGGDLTFLPPLFTGTQTGLPNLLYSSAAWGDFDNDGYMDVLLSGFDGTNIVAQVWRNPGNGSFSNMNVGLPGLYAGAVAWGDYDNDGYLDLLLTGADLGNNPATQLWHNNGNGTFTRNTNAALPGLYFGAVAWGDYDNDGKPDLLLTGADATSMPLTQLWHNDGNGSFSLNTNTTLPQVYASGVAWGDYDKDGRLDLLLSGTTINAPVTELWHNNGNGSFSLNTNAALPALYFSSVAWGDYDNDGRLDILLAGNDGSSPLCQVWHNDGNGLFTLNTNAVLPGTYQGSAAWGDYDADGKLDILLSGLDTSANPLTQIWRNNGNGTFSAVNVVLPGAFAGTAIWADVENDGKLDLLLTGGSTIGPAGPDVPITALFSNVGPSSNTPPGAPSGLAATVQSSSQVILSWNAASDSQTAAPGLNYNLRIGTTPGGEDVLAPAASLATGLRRLPRIGNAQEVLTNIVTRLAPGTYHWSVQAIDTSFAGGPFATESTFSIISSPPLITSFAYVAGQFQVQFNGQAGGNYTLQASTDLSQWAAITNIIVPTDGTYQVQDPAASSFQRRFYRLSLH